MEKMKSFVREQDIFGQEVSFNFDKKGKTYQTLFGGTLSIFFYMFIFSVTVYGFINVHNHS